MSGSGLGFGLVAQVRISYDYFKICEILLKNCWIMIFKKNDVSPLTLVLLSGVVPTPLRVFALVLKMAQPRGKIASGTFKFILSLHFSEKIPNLPPTPGIG